MDSRGTRADKAGQGSTILDHFGEVDILDSLEGEDLPGVLRPEHGIPFLGALWELNFKDCLTTVICHVETGLVKEEYWVLALNKERVDTPGFLIARAGDLVHRRNCQSVALHDG